MDLCLSNKKVLVTGASRGIGLCIARHFLEENAEVLIVARDEKRLDMARKELQDITDKTALSFSCDCTEHDSLEKLREYIQQTWGRLDVVIANIGDGRSVPDAIPEAEQWTKVWNINFESAIQTTRAFLPMLEKSKGSLVFVSSITGLEAFGAPVDYSTAKSAILAFSKNLSRKVAQNVRVNVIAPGNVNFPGGSWDQKIKDNPERVKKIIDSTVPMKRFGTPDEIADAVVFLSSNRASFITGSILVVDGGQTVGVF